MFKRLILLLALAGVTSTFAHSTQSSLVNGSVYACTSSIPTVKVVKILKVSAPQFGVSFSDAYVAHQKGNLTIQEIGVNTDLYSVNMGGVSIWVDLEEV